MAWMLGLVLEWAPGGDLLDYIINKNGLGEWDGRKGLWAH